MQNLRLKNVGLEFALIAQFTRADIDVGLIFTLEDGQRGVGLREVLLTAVFFFDGHVGRRRS